MPRAAKLHINNLAVGQKLRDTRNDNVGTIIGIDGTSLRIKWATGTTDTWANTNNLAMVDVIITDDAPPTVAVPKAPKVANAKAPKGIRRSFHSSLGIPNDLHFTCFNR